MHVKLTPPFPLIKLIPKTARAKTRVKEHGNIFVLKQTRPESVLVESIGDTWRGQKWMGWFSEDEADWEITAQVVNV